MNAKHIRALGLAAALVGWSFTAGLDKPWRRHPIAQAGYGTGLALAARAPLGLRPPNLISGWRLGGVVAGAVAAGVAVGAAVPQVRAAMLQRELPARPGHWLAVEIPLGTVWSEETAFRGALATVAGDAFGPSVGRMVQALTFGLTHVPDARGAGEPIGVTVAVTGLAGWVFGLLAERSGSLVAPMLAHLAINEAGAIAALAVRRFGQGSQFGGVRQ
ncbi:CPBP family intramembrane glutamic endopeptidase [Mycolicibacterium sp.]|uniref:Rv0804 family intramembrane glutamic endopeptidase n=1 Tax=Mycolicibacterium sp. TaxID=2320850 RepID=UPI0028ADE8C3|nr:CPBP family intramembrane glutamic endopeptidase [Mycolicibacterium sp.]